jgi:DNA primase
MQKLFVPLEEVRVEIPGFHVLRYPGKFGAYAERLESYLWDRGWTEREIIDRQVGFSLESKQFMNRLVFPFLNCSGEFCYYQSRTIKPDAEPKYLNPSLGKDRALYNVQRASRYDTCILVEGIFDCVLPNAVACLSKEPTEGQIRGLAGLWRDFVIMFDQDALLDSWKAAARLSALGCSCRVAKCPAKDPGEASLLNLETEIETATPYNQFGFAKTKLLGIEQRTRSC